MGRVGVVTVGILRCRGGGWLGPTIEGSRWLKAILGRGLTGLEGEDPTAARSNESGNK